MALILGSKLDETQILQLVVDEAASALRMSGSITAMPPSGITDVVIDHINDSIAIGTTAALFTGTASGAMFAQDVYVINPVTGMNVSGSISGTFQPVGLINGLSSTAVFASSTPIAIPVIPDQNGISIRVWRPTSAVVYFGSSANTFSDGYPKFYLEEIIADARNTPNVYIWVSTEGSATAELRVMRIA